MNDAFSAAEKRINDKIEILAVEAHARIYNAAMQTYQSIGLANIKDPRTYSSAINRFLAKREEISAQTELCKAFNTASYPGAPTDFVYVPNLDERLTALGYGYNGKPATGLDSLNWSFPHKGTIGFDLFTNRDGYIEVTVSTSRTEGRIRTGTITAVEEKLPKRPMPFITPKYQMD